MSSNPLPLPKQIRFVNNEGRPPAKRRRIDAACQTCRRRKIRCDGKKPHCDTCKENRHQCLGYATISPTESKPVNTTVVKREPVDDQIGQVYGNNTKEKRSVHTSEASGSHSNNRYTRPSLEKAKLSINPKASPPNLAESDDSPSYHDEPQTPQPQNRRVPYFRYFGPTAIVPGFKQMVVSVRDNRRSAGPNSISSASPLSNAHSDEGIKYPGMRRGSISDTQNREGIAPMYDTADTGPLPRLIRHLVHTFFLHLGCNFPFLRKEKITKMVEERRLAPILVDAICALAARFSEDRALVSPHGVKLPRSEYGQIYAQRAKALVTETFPCPSVAAVQACLLLAYEGFGDDKDSALWMYTGCAIRMALDLGLEKVQGVKLQRDHGPNYSPTYSESNKNKPSGSPDASALEEMKASEQERIDTLWAIFMLDRVISSGLGRPATMRQDEFELSLPEITNDPDNGWPRPFPALIQIIHMYGKVSDLLNSIKREEDITEKKIKGLSKLEESLVQLYHTLDERLTFKPENFQFYVKIGESTNFILLHFWFHTLLIIVHCPRLWTPFEGQVLELLPHSSPEISMSSAKTIADILAFAELCDPKSFIGNPFTSQPMYIAASAFLMETDLRKTSGSASREESPHKENRYSSRFLPLLGSNARHISNYQRCYKALQQLQTYWAGTKYILTALDQKSQGVADLQTFTSEEMESTRKRPTIGTDQWKARLPPTPFLPSPSIKSVSMAMSPKTDRSLSPVVVGDQMPVWWSLTGTMNSPSSHMSWMPQTGNEMGPPGSASPAPIPGNMVYDPVRQSVPETIRSTPATFSMPYAMHIGNGPMSPPEHQKFDHTIEPTNAHLAVAKDLLELRRSPQSYVRSTAHNTYTSNPGMQPGSMAAPHPPMQSQDVFGNNSSGTSGFDFANANAWYSSTGTLAAHGWMTGAGANASFGFMHGLGGADMMNAEVALSTLPAQLLSELEYMPFGVYDTDNADIRGYGGNTG